MKLAITGKGGVGKTTLASTLARLYADEGRTVLAADVDPDANLGLALGLSQEEVDAIVPISKMRTLVEERTGANAANKFFKLNPYVADIPDTFSKEINGVKLLVMGTVDVGGSGCVCPEHVMLKAILSALTYRKNDVVIMDMEAGLEHLRTGNGSQHGSVHRGGGAGRKSGADLRTTSSVWQRTWALPAFGVVANKVRGRRRRGIHPLRHSRRKTCWASSTTTLTS